MKVLDQREGENWVAYQGDCVEVIRGLPDESIHYTIFSPPFASLYTYSSSPRDMGNCADDRDFAEHFSYLVPELYRVTKPGRLLSFHCMQLPTTKARDGYIGLKDFRGDLIRAFIDAGWIYHSEVVIWKDPVTAMQRTKALGLLHKTIRNDSSMSRQGLPDYLVTMRKPGENPEPVTHTESGPGLLGHGPDADAETRKRAVEVWQRYASPVWVTTRGVDSEGFAICEPDINPSDTLQFRSAREDKDERHIAPLQLEVIRRGIRLWTNPGDTVLTPFGGIGSEGVVAIEEKRRAVLIELKRSYFEQQVRNLEEASIERQLSLLDTAV